MLNNEVELNSVIACADPLFEPKLVKEASPCDGQTQFGMVCLGSFLDPC